MKLEKEFTGYINDMNGMEWNFRADVTMSYDCEGPDWFEYEDVVLSDGITEIHISKLTSLVLPHHFKESAIKDLEEEISEFMWEDVAYDMERASDRDFWHYTQG